MISLNWDYYRDPLIILSKTISIRHPGTISDTDTPSVNQYYLLNISLHLTIDCVSVYGHLVYDITKLQLLQGCVDYTVKNDLDSSSRHHFWPIYTFRWSNYLLNISLHLKIDCVSVYGHLVYDITKLQLLQGSLIIQSKTILIRLLGTISETYTPSDHQIYSLNISLHQKLIALTSMALSAWNH